MTNITITEVEPSLTDSRLGSFAPVGGLKMEPAGLQLLQDVSISYLTDLVRPAKSAGTPRVQPAADPLVDNFELMIAVLLGEESSSIPEQEIEVDLRLNYLNFKFGVPNFADLYWGPPINPDRPAAGDHFSLFTVRFATPGETIVVGEPFEADIELDTASTDYFRLTNFDLGFLQFPYVWDEDSLDTAIIITSPTKYTYSTQPQITAQETEESSLEVALEFLLDLPDIEVLDLPDNIVEPMLQLKYEIKMRPVVLDIQLCLDPPCDTFDNIFFTGMTGLAGMSVNHVDADESDPDGELFPWLYVTGSTGVQYYRLARTASGILTGAFKRGEVLSLDARGTVPVSVRDGVNRVRGLFTYGISGSYRSHWNHDPAVNDYGALLVIGGLVDDAVAYGGYDQADGFTFVGNGVVRFTEYDPQYNIFTEPLDSSLFFDVAFKGAFGPPVSAFVDPAFTGVLVATAGSPGQIWYHDRQDIYAVGTPVTTIGNDVRQLRGVGGIMGVTNFGSNSVSILTWTGGSAVTNHGQTTVGTGPVGLDVIGLANGNVAMVCTSSTDNTYTILEVDPGGNLVLATTIPLAAGCSGAKYAVWVPGPITYVAISCGDTGFVTLEETTLVSE